MKDRLLHTIKDSSPKLNAPAKRKLSKKQTIAVAHVFKRVTPVFNAVAKATSMAELKVCQSTCDLMTTECLAY